MNLPIAYEIHENEIAASEEIASLSQSQDGQKMRAAGNSRLDMTVMLENVGVRYRVPSERIATFKEYMIRRIQGRVHNREFWALRKVNLSTHAGEVFGLIGANGAGKSTLLKLVARVLKPTEGRVVVHGRVAPLLEVGAGFHGELTGRENVYLNGALLGFTYQQMEEKFPRIVDFAELWDFIDAPMRTYSSGMWARLGFAVATDEQPDVLIVDEVLSVGDEAFQRKSFERILHFRDGGATILLVSHNLAMVESLCHQVAWMDHGGVHELGEAKQVIDHYRASV
jgi:ABC-2 type transport system ATP-binding protein